MERIYKVYTSYASTRKHKLISRDSKESVFWSEDICSLWIFPILFKNNQTENINSTLQKCLCYINIRCAKVKTESMITHSVEKCHCLKPQHTPYQIIILHTRTRNALVALETSNHRTASKDYFNTNEFYVIVKNKRSLNKVMLQL